MEKLLIIGASGHGRVVGEIASLSESWGDIVFSDDNNASVEGFRTIGTTSTLENYIEDYSYAFVAIGDNHIRINFLEVLKRIGYKIPTLIHPRSIISRSANLGPGTVVMAGAIINPGCTVGSGCILNTGCTVDHDCILGDGVHISPGAHLAGNVHVSACSWVCVGASIINNKKIGVNSIVAAGSAVITDVPDNVLMAGTPAKIKRNFFNYI